MLCGIRTDIDAILLNLIKISLHIRPGGIGMPFIKESVEPDVQGILGEDEGREDDKC